MERKLGQYLELIKGFVDGVISVDDFENTYLGLVKKEAVIFNEKTARIIETLFSDIDSYCGDPEIANYDSSNPFADIDETELRKRAKRALNELLLSRD